MVWLIGFLNLKHFINFYFLNMNYLNITKGEEILLKAASVGAAVLGLIGVYNFYKNNIWHPKIEVISVDFNKGVANLKINGKPFVLRGDSSYLIAYDWGIKFGFLPTNDGRRVYDRIEVLKRNMVHQVIRKADDEGVMNFVGVNESTFWNDAFEGDKGGLVAVASNFTGNEKILTQDVWGVKSGDGFSLFQEK